MESFNKLTSDNMDTSKTEKPQDLEERTYTFALRTRLLLKQREWDPTSWSDVQQLLRSSGSVASNYLEAQDALSSDDFVYRIHVGQIPFLTGISPLGATAGEKVEITFQGGNLGASVKHSYQVPADTGIVHLHAESGDVE
ncbi:MAG: four helix bundle protein, partial [Akkermansiaceae bacterium]|nr:four helix bundle protein [Akkermansiaceae bacterium]